MFANLGPMEIVIGLVCVLVVVALALVGFIVVVYNSLVGRRVETQNAWSQIDVQLKRRYDLIPNLVETVKGYASHEKDTLEKVIQARNAAMNATGPAEHAAAERRSPEHSRRSFRLPKPIRTSRPTPVS